jgi:hypothetical protein
MAGSFPVKKSGKETFWTMLRYAIEKFEPVVRQIFLKGEI